MHVGINSGCKSHQSAHTRITTTPTNLQNIQFFSPLIKTLQQTFTMPTKTIAVLGATGNQGSSVAKSFLTSGWHVRCLTRNPASSAAEDLHRLGGELIQADLGDASSIAKALDSVHVIFANIDFWTAYRDPSSAQAAAAAGKSLGQYSYDVEVQHGKALIQAAAAVPTLERLIYSGLPPMDKTASAEIAECFHWDAKAATIKYLRDQYPDLNDKTSIIYLAAYADNAFIIPRWVARTHSYKIMVPMRPDAVLPAIDTRNSTGPYVEALIEEPAGTHLWAYDSESRHTMAEYAQLWSQVTGMDVSFEMASVQYMVDTFGLPREVLAGPVLVDKYGYMHGVDGFIEPSQLKVQPKTTPYREWLADNWRDILPSRA